MSMSCGYLGRRCIATAEFTNGKRRCDVSGRHFPSGSPLAFPRDNLSAPRTNNGVVLGQWRYRDYAAALVQTSMLGQELLCRALPARVCGGSPPPNTRVFVYLCSYLLACRLQNIRYAIRRVTARLDAAASSLHSGSKIAKLDAEVETRHCP